MSELSIPLTPQVLFYLLIAMIAGGMLVAQFARQFGPPEKKRSSRRRPRPIDQKLPPIAKSTAPSPRDPQLDQDLARLQDLVLTAERQIGRLEELIRTTQTMAPRTTNETPVTSHDDSLSVNPIASPSPPSPPVIAPETTAADPKSSLGGNTPPEPKSEVPEQRPRMLSLFVGEPSATNSNPRYRELHRLFEAGFSNQEISQRLGVPIGEVDLVLGLRQHAQRLQSGQHSARLDEAG